MTSLSKRLADLEIIWAIDGDRAASKVICDLIWDMQWQKVLWEGTAPTKDLSDNACSRSLVITCNSTVFAPVDSGSVLFDSGSGAKPENYPPLIS